MRFWRVLVLIQVVGAATPQNCSLRSRFCWKPQPRSAADKPTRFERKKPINATSVATKGEVAAKPLGDSSPFFVCKTKCRKLYWMFFSYHESGVGFACYESSLLRFACGTLFFTADSFL